MERRWKDIDKTKKELQTRLDYGIISFELSFVRMRGEISSLKAENAELNDS